MSTATQLLDCQLAGADLDAMRALSDALAVLILQDGHGWRVSDGWPADKATDFLSRKGVLFPVSQKALSRYQAVVDAMDSYAAVSRPKHVESGAYRRHGETQSETMRWLRQVLAEQRAPA